MCVHIHLLEGLLYANDLRIEMTLKVVYMWWCHQFSYCNILVLVDLKRQLGTFSLM